MASHAEEPARRDFLVIAGNMFAAVGGAAVLWPFIHQMNPDAGTQALASTEVDLTPVKEGQAITVLWRGKPVFIRNRTQGGDREGHEGQAIEGSAGRQRAQRRAARDDARRPTPTAPRRARRTGSFWSASARISAASRRARRIGDCKGDYGGWFCPCHGSHYDTAGRIRKGPAPRNLEVPPYEFVSDTKIKIG